LPISSLACELPLTSDSHQRISDFMWVDLGALWSTLGTRRSLFLCTTKSQYTHTRD
ncbi:hypothetical protein COCCADRAFT_106191, partial [Bipolaris zeicola 26-R-13]